MVRPLLLSAAPAGAAGRRRIFFDHHFSGDAEADFAFTRDVGEAFLDAYPRIIRRRMGASLDARRTASTS